MRGRTTQPARVQWPGPAGFVELRLHHVPHLATRDVHLIASQVNATAEQHARQPGAPPHRVLLAPYIRRQQADVLEQARIGYFDLAGNVHIDLPGLHLEVKRVERVRLYEALVQARRDAAPGVADSLLRKLRGDEVRREVEARWKKLQ